MPSTKAAPFCWSLMGGSTYKNKTAGCLLIRVIFS